MAETVGGDRTSVVLAYPFPSWPSKLAPQHTTPPADDRTAQVCESPEAIPDTGRVEGDADTLGVTEADKDMDAVTLGVAVTVAVTLTDTVTEDVADTEAEVVTLPEALLVGVTLPVPLAVLLLEGETVVDGVTLADTDIVTVTLLLTVPLTDAVVVGEAVVLAVGE